MRIYSQDIVVEFGIEKCTTLIMKSGKEQMTEGIELPNQEKIRTLEEKETYNYLKILEADTIKYAEMKENMQRWKKKDFKNTSGERENYSKPNYIAEISSKK